MNRSLAPPVPHAVDELVSPFQEETVEAIKLFPEERTSEAHNTRAHAPGAHLGAYTRTNRRSTR